MTSSCRLQTETQTWSPSNLSRERLLVEGNKLRWQAHRHRSKGRPISVAAPFSFAALALLQHELDQFQFLVAGVGELRGSRLRLKYELRRRQACLSLRVLDFVQQLSVIKRNANTRPGNR